jgi:hypothetical protein
MSWMSPEIRRGALRTLFFFLLILAIQMLWEGTDLFLYERF